MKCFIKRTLFLATLLVVLSSCAKEEFSSIKAKQSGSTTEAITTSSVLCSQKTLISPKVDILMLWDNSSSFNFVNSQTKASMSNLISSVSEKFDYHILSAPLIPAGEPSTSGSLNQAQLVVKNTDGLTSEALAILKTKENATSNLAFSQGVGSTEAGVSRTIAMLKNNRDNGIFRNGAYTIIVVISNEDEKMCANCNSQAADDNYINPKIAELLSIRGNTFDNPGSTGYLNSTMMRFINVSRLTSCKQINGSINYMYRKTARDIYNATYSNGWPTSNDHLSPDVPGYPDSYDLCAQNFNFSNIFDGVNTAIKQTLILHKYDYWPLASATTAVDPDTVKVIRSDGTILANRAVDLNTKKGFEIVLDTNGDIKNYTQNTRYEPTPGEPFTGKLIKLYSDETSNSQNDKVIYPDCLTITYTEPKSTYGYIYLKNGKPNISTMLVKINGNTIPQSSSNGWDYMELQYTETLDLENFKAFGLPAGISSGYFLRLNGSARVQNNRSNTFDVYYNSASQ